MLDRDEHRNTMANQKALILMEGNLGMKSRLIIAHNQTIGVY